MKNLFWISIFAITLCCAGCDKSKEVDPIENDNKVYAVGDYYNKAGVTGIVYKISNNGKNGMIISMDQLEDGIWQNEPFSETKATDTKNGKNNFNTIKNGGFDLNDFPSFKWCNDKNKGGITGWYLPARDEVADITAVRYKIERSLQKHGGTPFYFATMWTSTELDETHACNYSIAFDHAREEWKDYNDMTMTRAVRAF